MVLPCLWSWYRRRMVKDSANSHPSLPPRRPQASLATVPRTAQALALPPVLALGLALALAASLGLPRCSPIKKMPFVRCAR